VRAIRATFPWLRGLTLSGGWQALRRAGLRVRSGRIQQDSPDPAYATKRDHLLACRRDAATHPDAVVLLFLDEMGFYRWPEPAADGGVAAPAAAPVAARGGPPNRQWRIMGALHALTGQVTYRDAYIIGRAKGGTCYHQLVAAYPQARRLYVVHDNWSIHTHPDVCAVLASLPPITAVWLPTYAPWLNPIAKLWRWLRADVLTLQRLADDWDALRARVTAFLDQFAADSDDLLHYVGLLGDGRLATARRAA